MIMYDYAIIHVVIRTAFKEFFSYISIIFLGNIRRQKLKRKARGITTVLFPQFLKYV